MSHRTDEAANYFQSLSQGVGGAWNRFWFTPADAYPLAVLRIFVGLASLAYLASHSSDLVRWFGPSGLLPIETVNQLTGATAGGVVAQRIVFLPSYFYLTTDPGMLWLLHVLGMLVLLAFTAGFATRITNVLSVIVVMSYVHRAPMITGQIEPILTMILIYLCLGPSGAHLSVDRWLGWTRARQPLAAAADGGQAFKSWTANLSLRLIQTHLAGFYLLMGLSKLGGETWWNGNAVWWLAARSESRLIDLTSLHEWTFLFNVWTHSIVLFELAFALLIWNKLARPLLLAVSVLMWTSLALVTGLVGFSAMMLVANLAFVPAESLRSAGGSASGKLAATTGKADSAAASKEPAAAG